VIVGAGSDYLFMLLSMILGKDVTIAFEDPAYRQAYNMAKEIGYHTVSVSLDKQGIYMDELEKSGADIAYVTPSHQYPTGIVMPVKRRQELIKWAYQSKDRYIIEDDYDSEFRYKGKPIPALQGYGGEEKVIYLGTFSKAIAPAIRLGYMILPQSLLNTYYEKCGFVSSTVSKVDQMIVQKFMEEGHFERHLNRMRAVYKARHDVLIEGLKPFEKICKISGENAGVHVLLTFEKDRTEEELINLAAKQDIRIYGMSEYYIKERKTENPTILLGYADLKEEEIKEALEVLKNIFEV
jgi:GntR family transcriptional regulator/MocR family aminotransferase